MKSRFLPIIGVATLVAAPSLPTWAQNTAPVNAPTKISHEITASKPVLGTDTPNTTSVFAPAALARPLKVALYEGPGSGDSGVEAVCARVAMISGSTVVRLKPAELGTTDLTPFDLVVFSGGSGSAQAKAIGEKGLQNVRAYVKNGGGYLGICAGAYLACSNYPWSLGLLNARTIQPWLRGPAFLKIELSDEGRAKFGDVRDKFWVRYHNGPVIEPDNKPNLPPYTVEAWFRTAVVRDGNPVGVMVNSPAVVSGIYGKGRVMTISPHPEDSKGLENFVPRAMAWIAHEEAPAAK